MIKYLQAGILKAAVVEVSGVSLDVVVHEIVDSTNSWSIQQCQAGRKLPFTCFAEEQTSGKGRRGKQWAMCAFSNIAMSLAWPFSLSYQQLHFLPLSIAMAIVETLEGLGLQQVQIKWPNDVYVRGKKIAGILIETQPVGCKQVVAASNDGKYTAVVVGVGLNYDMSGLGDEERRVLPALTDICGEVECQLLDVRPGRTKVAARLLQHVVAACEKVQLEPRHYLEKFRRQYDFCKDKNIDIVTDDNRMLSGIACGVNDDAELRVLIDGIEQVFNSAQVSVKAAVS